MFGVQFFVLRLYANDFAMFAFTQVESERSDFFGDYRIRLDPLV